MTPISARKKMPAVPQLVATPRLLRLLHAVPIVVSAKAAISPKRPRKMTPMMPRMPATNPTVLAGTLILMGGSAANGGLVSILAMGSGVSSRVCECSGGALLVRGATSPEHESLDYGVIGGPWDSRSRTIRRRSGCMRRNTDAVQRPAAAPGGRDIPTPSERSVALATIN